MRLTTCIGFLTGLLAWAAFTQADPTPLRLTVDAGKVPRSNAPIAATIKSPPLVEVLREFKLAGSGTLIPADANGAAKDEKPAAGAGASGAIPVQIERVGDDTVIMRWIEPDLQPGQPKTYKLDLDVKQQRKPVFAFAEGDGFRDLKFGDRGVYRHMTRYDPADHAATFKPFHHIFGMHGEGFITNGPGSEEWGKSGEGIRFPHHRGLFFGYNKTPYGDFWHGKDGVSQRHREYIKGREFSGPVAAREVSVNEWTTAHDKPIIRDMRELTTWRVDDEHIVLDFEVTLETLTGETVQLRGDAQHSGFHFRAANSVGQDDAATQPTTRGSSGGNVAYIRPERAVAKGNDVWADCPWVYAGFSIKGHPYGVSEMNAPTNPEPTVFSTRPYGRFGAFVNDQEVSPGKPLKLKYRFIVRSPSEPPDAKQLESEYQAWITPVTVTAENK
ncbi:MAG TPA: DUF6807 family protein [Tepidisphaeraceae bacterium]|nr:DUF6807 family protein [Tepidisphaeraceae bacterium]